MFKKSDTRQGFPVGISTNIVFFITPRYIGVSRCFRYEGSVRAVSGYGILRDHHSRAIRQLSKITGNRPTNKIISAGAEASTSRSSEAY